MERKANKVFVTLKEVTGKNELIDPFVLKETLGGLVNVGDASTSQNGEYVIHILSTQAERLTRLKKLKDGTKVKCELHPTKNTVRCVIQHSTIAKLTDSKLEKELAPQGVLKVKGIGPAKGIKLLTIKGTSIPTHVSVGLLKVKTKKYYPMVKQCKKCRLIGHFTERCKAKARCINCSGAVHSLQCERKPHCGNCGGDHPPADKQCPIFVQEREIIRIAVDGDTSTSKARKEYKKRHEYRLLPNEGALIVEDEEEVITIDDAEDEGEVADPQVVDPPSNVTTPDDKGIPETVESASADPPSSVPTPPAKTKRKRSSRNKSSPAATDEELL